MIEFRSEGFELRLKLNGSSTDYNLERVLPSIIPDVVPTATFVLSTPCNITNICTLNWGSFLQRNITSALYPLPDVVQTMKRMRKSATFPYRGITQV